MAVNGGRDHIGRIAIVRNRLAASSLNPALISVILYGTGAVLTYLARALLARSLGPSAYGSVSVVVGVATLAAGVGSFGLPIALTRYIAYAPDRSEDERSLIIASGLSVLTLGAFFAGLMASVAAFLFLPQLRMAFPTDVLAYTVLVTLMAVAEGTIAVVRGLRRIRRALVIRELLYRGFLVLALAGLLTVWGASIRGAVGVYLLAQFLYCLVAFGAVSQATSFLHQRTLWRRSRLVGQATSLIAFSWPVIGSFISIQIVNQADNLFLVFFRGPTAVGVYNAAFPLSQMVWMVSDAVVFVAGPLLARAHGRKDLSGFAGTYRQLTLFACVSAFVLAAPLVLMPAIPVRLIFGNGYVGASTALSILAAGAWLYSLSGVAGSSLIAAGYTRQYLVTDIGGLALNLALHTVLVPAYGIEGAAVAVAASYGTVAILRIIYVRRLLNVNPIPASVLLAVCILAIVGGIAWKTATAILGSSIAGLLALYACLGLAGLLIVILQANEVDPLAVTKKLRVN